MRPEHQVNIGCPLADRRTLLARHTAADTDDQVRITLLPGTPTAELGVREVNLLGQNVNAYRGALHDGGHADLALLIRYLAAIEGIGRIRYTTSHPVALSDSLVDTYADVPELVSHLHLPVQSGSDAILAAMKRGHTVLEYKSKIRRLRRVRPDMAISSDFIVGFPGETEEDFAATLALVDEIRFDTSFSFIYSRRPGTPAADYPDAVPGAVKQARLARLQERLDQHARTIGQRLVGTVRSVLVEGPSRKDPVELAGRYRPVLADQAEGRATAADLDTEPRLDLAQVLIELPTEIGQALIVRR